MSKIEWTDETWNPVTGCTKISAGCANCYAERMARRLAGRYGYPETPHHFDVTLHPERLELPLRWQKPRMVFVCSMGDLFHKDVDFGFIAEIVEVMEATPEHTYQILTKRPARLLEFTEWLHRENYDPSVGMFGFFEWPRNVWLGVTAENQAAADERIPLLLQTPAAVRFVSCEPLLGAIDLNDIPNIPDSAIDPATETWGLHWLIVGGESGPGARPMHPDWARSLRDQAQAAGVHYFFKQWGAWLWVHPDRESWEFSKPLSKICQVDDMRFYRVGKKAAGRLLDGREWNEMPATGSSAE